MRKIAIFGGTFNPIHQGHLFMAEATLTQFELKQIIWVPTFHPFYKREPPLEFEHRLTMVQGAIAEHPAFALSDIEAQQNGGSYAINTLTNLQKIHPVAHWHWILGLDTFQTLPRWYKSDELASQCTWLVAPRSGQNAELQCRHVAAQMLTRSIPLDWHLIQMPCVNISSSLIRQYCREGQSIRGLLPETVRAYIEDQNLYQIS